MSSPPTGTTQATQPSSETLVVEEEAQSSTVAASTSSGTSSDTGGGGFWGFVNTLKEKGGSALETLTHDLDEFKTTISHDTTEAIHKAEQKATEVLAPALTGRTSDGDQGTMPSTNARAANTTATMGKSTTVSTNGKIAPPPPTPLSQQQQQQQQQHSTLEDLGSKVESLTTSFWTLGTQFIQEVTASAGTGNAGEGNNSGSGGSGSSGSGSGSFASASEARLAALQRNERTYTEEPQEGAELDTYLAFSETLNLPLMTDEISRMMAQYPELRKKQNTLVPHVVSYQTFWRRYLFRFKQFRADAERRSKLVSMTTQSSADGDDDDFDWGSDTEDTPTTTATTTTTTTTSITSGHAPSPAPVPTPAPVPEPASVPVPVPVPVVATSVPMARLETPTPLSSDGDSSWTDGGVARPSQVEGGSSSDGWTNLPTKDTSSATATATGTGGTGGTGGSDSDAVLVSRHSSDDVSTSVSVKPPPTQSTRAPVTAAIDPNIAVANTQSSLVSQVAKGDVDDDDDDDDDYDAWE